MGKKLRGGESVGTGSDGCVFDKKFDSDGNPTADTGIATKIYPKNNSNLADAELKLSNAVYNVVPKDASGVPIAAIIGRDLKILPTVKDKITKYQLACNELNNDIVGKKTGFKALEMPLILGDLLDKEGDSYFNKYEFYSKLIETVKTLPTGNLFHGDIANRNIFEVQNNSARRYGKEARGIDQSYAALGDFGNMINLNESSDLIKNITYYCESHYITADSDFSKIFSKDGSTPAANLTMAMYMISTSALEKLPEKIEYIKSIVLKTGERYPFEDISFILNGYSGFRGVIHKDAMRKITKPIADHYIPQMVDLLNYLSTQRTPDEYLRLAKLHMLDSDLKMLSVVMCHKGVEDNEAFAAWTTSPGMPSLHSVEPFDAEDFIAKLQARMAAIGSSGGRKTRKYRRFMKRNTRKIRQ